MSKHRSSVMVAFMCLAMVVSASVTNATDRKTKNITYTVGGTAMTFQIVGVFKN